MTLEEQLERLAILADQYKTLAHNYDAVQKERARLKEVEDTYYKEMYAKRQQYMNLAESLLLSNQEGERDGTK